MEASQSWWFCERALASTQFLQIQRNQLIDLQKQLEQFCNILTVFVFNSGKYDLKLYKFHLLPLLINERDIESTVIKKANQIISFRFSDIQLLGIKKFPGGATSPTWLLKAYTKSKKKGF